MFYIINDLRILHHSGIVHICQALFWCPGARILWAILCIQALHGIPMHISHNHLRLRFETQLRFPAQGLCGNQQQQEQKGLDTWQQLKRAWGNLADFIHHRAAGEFQGEPTPFPLESASPSFIDSELLLS